MTVSGLGGDRVAEVGVIGGSGFYKFLDHITDVHVETNCGSPSGPIAIGLVSGRRVAFLARHGVDHEHPPHKINYRANMMALWELGVSRVIAPCAVGSLRADLRPGDFLVPDQLVNRTAGRNDTYIEEPPVEHISFADPYCPELRESCLKAGGLSIVRDGTVVVVPGPRFSTRAESAELRRNGWDVVNMTQYPEAYLARELGLCYSALALVTDYDTGIQDDPTSVPVTMQSVLAVLADNVDRARSLLMDAIPLIPYDRGCGCATSGSPRFRR
jgi:5'-methylthioadenosine phosphorylase